MSKQNFIASLDIDATGEGNQDNLRKLLAVFVVTPNRTSPLSPLALVQETHRHALFVIAVAGGIVPASTPAAPEAAALGEDHGRRWGLLVVDPLLLVVVQGHEDAALRYVTRVVRHLALQLGDEVGNAASALGWWGWGRLFAGGTSGSTLDRRGVAVVRGSWGGVGHGGLTDWTGPDRGRSSCSPSC